MMGSRALTARAVGRASRARRLGGLLAGMLLLTATARRVDGPQTPDGQALPSFDPRHFAEYGNARLAIETYLAQHKSRPRGANHFCTVAYGPIKGDTDRAPIAYVHWVEGKRLILWEPEAEHFHEQDLSLVMSRRDWDMVRDVQRHPDPYRMTDWIIERSFVDAVLADCARVGQRLTIAVPPPGSREARRPE